ncbi:MAG TPA: DUF1572 family protein [Acidobacteriaceae bacterium]|nr:DUF1572 family protein [Acidobacteriaceae bacterium]
MALEFTTSYLEDSIVLLRYYKKLAERAIAQATDAQLYQRLDDDANSIAIVMQHMAGNMKSRWTNFLSQDGEKPWRNRDSEFERPPATRGALLQMWEDGWDRVFQALESLTDPDLNRTVPIRGEAHSVMQAINRQVAHYAYHCGQIVLLAKHFQHAQWTSLTIPKGKSEEFNARVRAREASQR